ncbi:MAG: cation transporter [Pyrinomonadaceae bacterium]
MPMNSALSARRTVVAAVFINMTLALIKVAAGVLGNSYALIADGIESTLDVFTSVAVWGGLHVAVKPPRCQSSIRSWSRRIAFGARRFPGGHRRRGRHRRTKRSRDSYSAFSSAPLYAARAGWRSSRQREFSSDAF